jgi:hypothetical protein
VQTTDNRKTAQLFFVIVAIACLLFAVGYGAWAIWFLGEAREADATVLNIQSKRLSCEEKVDGRTRRYPCAAFTAIVRYAPHDSPGAYREAKLDAGRAHGYDQSISAADVRIGQSIRILYRDRASDEVYRADTTFGSGGLWRRIIPALLIGLLFLYLARKARSLPGS